MNFLGSCQEISANKENRNGAGEKPTGAIIHVAKHFLSKSTMKTLKRTQSGEKRHNVQFMWQSVCVQLLPQRSHKNAHWRKKLQVRFV